jgi:hypothetical protein
MIGGSSRSRGRENFLFANASRPALVLTQPPIQWVTGAISLVLKWPGREPDQSPPSSAEFKNAKTISPLPDTPPWRGAQLKKSTVTTLLSHVTLL